MLTANEQLVMLAISRCGKDAYALSIQEEIKVHGHTLDPPKNAPTTKKRK